MGFQAASQANVDDDAGPMIVAVAMAVATLSGLALVARLTSRQIQKKRFGPSDLLVVLGLLCAWVVSVLAVLSVKIGLGRHLIVIITSDDAVWKLDQNLLHVYLGQIFYTLSLVCIKISILLFYREIFVGDRFLLATKLIGLFVLAWGVACLGVSIFSCRPVSGFWDWSFELQGKCVDHRRFFLGNSVPNILGDVAILVLPINEVWKLQMPKRSKTAVSCLFLLGSFVVIASCMRLSAIVAMDLFDATWTYVGISVWSPVELNVAVISACLPTIRPLLKAISHSRFSLKVRGGIARIVNSSEEVHQLERLSSVEQGKSSGKSSKDAVFVINVKHWGFAEPSPVPSTYDTRYRDS